MFNETFNKPISSLKIQPLPNRSFTQNGQLWLKDKQLTDGAEKLWRIYNNLYDLKTFIKLHPGGAEWLQLTKGTDITEAFEVHHFSKTPSTLLKQFFVKTTNSKRNSPFTFKENGFYKVLKNEIIKKMLQVPKQSENTSKFITDCLVVAVFTFATLATLLENTFLAFFAGFLLSSCITASHNYFHMANNFRMYYFNLCLMQLREWRISHVLSHHLHTNTINDLEIIQIEPTFYFLPFNKTKFQRFGPFVYFPIVWAFAWHINIAKRLFYIILGNLDLICWYDWIPYTLPLTMYLLAQQSFVYTFYLWNVVLCVGSLHFSAISYNAHHHPDIFHDGDEPRKDSEFDYDWGISQLDTVMDRYDISGSHFLVLTHFGDHALHHLFPTLDHGTLDYLYPVFEQVCKKFDVKVRTISQFGLIKGAFAQIAKTEKNRNPPDLFKSY